MEDRLGKVIKSSQDVPPPEIKSDVKKKKHVSVKIKPMQLQKK